MPSSFHPDRLKRLRTERGWSQADLADHIDSDTGQVSRDENGKVTPSLEAATRIAETFNVTLDYLVFDDAPPPLHAPANAVGARLADLDNLTDDERTTITAPSPPKPNSASPPAEPADMDIGDHPPSRQIRAEFDDTTLTVYQAYSPQIADAALKAGTFVPPFKLTRMTWIKPSFLWMMYRSGWATKPGQQRILAVRITREGFEEALGSACLSHFDADVYAAHAAWEECKRTSAVRLQWDPERTPNL